MNCLDRYILAGFCRIFFLSTGAFAGLYLLIDFFEKVDNFIFYQAAPFLYLFYFASKIPLIVTQVLPLAVLMGVFMTLGGLSRTSELTAMRAGGLSLWRIAAPLLCISAGMSLLLLLAGEFVVPASVRTMNQIYEMEVKGKPGLSLRRENVWFREGTDIVHVRLALPEKLSLQGVTIYRVDADFSLSSRLDAQEAVFRNEKWLISAGIRTPFLCKRRAGGIAAPRRTLVAAGKNSRRFRRSKRKKSRIGDSRTAADDRKASG